MATPASGKTSPIPLHFRPMAAMLRYRGYQEISTLTSGQYSLIFGEGQSLPDHPRPEASALVLVDPSPHFSSSELLKALRTLYIEGIRKKLPPDSSIAYVYSFPRTRIHSAAIERNYSAILVEYDHRMTYYLEDMQASLFNVDWTVPRAAKNWRLHREDHYVLMYTQNDEPVYVDRPPSIMCESPEIKYLGGRPNDYTSFDRLENAEVGPIWLHTMRKIGKKVEAKIGETSSDEPGEADDGAGDESRDR